MSNFEAQDVDFTTLEILIGTATKLGYISYQSDIATGQRVSARLYEVQALENIVGEMKCLINEVTKRATYLKNVIAEDI